jgi:hypothetical protein
LDFGAVFLLFAQYPQEGQPFLKSASSPVRPHWGQRTEENTRPQEGQRPVLRSTSTPQFSQKNRAPASGIVYPAALAGTVVFPGGAVVPGQLPPEAAAAGQEAQASLPAGFFSPDVSPPSAFFASFVLPPEEAAFLSVT